MFHEEKTREVVKELTLLLMYLNHFTVNRKCQNDSGVFAWKGYDFDVLNELDEEDYIRQGSRRSKSVCLTEEGVKKAQEIYEKYVAKQHNNSLEK
ncbi:MAG: DUF6429 family protein [Bacillota bacterium]|nr:DUF6429 family protein [Bacillota bacterium]